MGNKKGIPEKMVGVAMSLYQGAKTKVRVETKFLEKVLVKVGVHQELVL